MNVQYEADRIRLRVCLTAIAWLCLWTATGQPNRDLAWADSVTVITDIHKWRHPVKTIFKKYQVKLYKLELYRNKTYPVFYVRLPYDPHFAHNDRFFTPFYHETLKANGFWDYALVDQQANVKIAIGWDKRTKTMTQDVQDLD